MFQSSQPVRVGFSFALPKVQFLLRFNHPNQRGLGLLLLHRYRPHSIISIIPAHAGWVKKMKVYEIITAGFNHPSPRGLGQRNQNPSHWIKSFNHPSPRGLSPMVLPIDRILSRFNHPNPREGWVRLTIRHTVTGSGFQSSFPVWGRVTTAHFPMSLSCYFNHPAHTGWV